MISLQRGDSGIAKTDIFVTNFQKSEDLQSKTITLGGLRAEATRFGGGDPSVLGGHLGNRAFWLLQATFTHESIYKPTRSTGPKILQTYKPTGPTNL